MQVQTLIFLTFSGNCLLLSPLPDLAPLPPRDEEPPHDDELPQDEPQPGGSMYVHGHCLSFQPPPFQPLLAPCHPSSLHPPSSFPDLPSPDQPLSFPDFPPEEDHTDEDDEPHIVFIPGVSHRAEFFSWRPPRLLVFLLFLPPLPRPRLFPCL